MATILWQKDGVHAVTALVPGVDAGGERDRLAAGPMSGWSFIGYDMANPDPPPPPVLSWAEFRALIPEARQIAIAAAVLQSPALLVFCMDAASQGVDLGSARTATGLQALVDATLLSSDERDLLLAGAPIPA